MVAKNIRVLKEVDLKSFRNSFYHFFSTFFYHFFQCISLIYVITSFLGGGGGGRGERGRKSGRSTRMRLAGGDCFVLTSLVSCSQPAISDTRRNLPCICYSCVLSCRESLSFLNFK